MASLNEQLQKKVEELEQANDDLINLQVSAKIAMLVLDTRLCIQRFNPETQQLLHLIPTDIGRPVTDLSAHFIDHTHARLSLHADAESVLDTLIPLERDVQTADGLWYIQRILPYRTQANRSRQLHLLHPGEPSWRPI